MKTWDAPSRHCEAKIVLQKPFGNLFQGLILLSEAPSTTLCVCMCVYGEETSMADHGDVLVTPGLKKQEGICAAGE